MNPLVSVIIPYNKDRGYLFQAVDSVLKQTYINVECITQFGDNTTGKNFNEGLLRSKGDLIMVCAEDDYLTPDAVERLVDGMNGFDFVCANAWLMHDDGKQVPYKSQVPRNYRVLIEYNSIHGGTVMYRRNVLEAVGGMDETLWTAEEFDMNVRLLKTGFKLGYVDAFVQHNRIHDRSKSRTYMADKEKRAERIFYIETLKSRLI